MTEVNNQKQKGKAYLVGAGPGRADLITLRGAELIKKADCIICDKLANQQLLTLARNDAEIINTPKRVGPNSFTQEQVNQLLLEKVLAGKNVVRLKGGDPCIFGRCAQEALLLAQAGVEFEIVPGITAAIAAADYTGIMLTDRKFSSQVVFVTGREDPNKQHSGIDWDLLAKFNGTIVFYMGMGTLKEISTRLIENGMPSSMPAAVISQATTPEQRVTKATIAEIYTKCQQQHIEAPAIIIIGKTADSNEMLDWYMKRPLFGKTIVMTRDNRGNSEFAEQIICRGGNPIEYPTIKIQPLTDKQEFLKTLTKLQSFDWIIFTSCNGVRICFSALAELDRDARVFGTNKIAAIGKRTAECIRSYGIEADFVPSVFTGKELGLQLAGHANLSGEKILLFRSQMASDELVNILEQAGAEVNNISIYTIAAEKGDDKKLTEKIESRKIDWLTFASPSAVESFCKQIEPSLINSSRIKVASIGPITNNKLDELGMKVDITAQTHTMEGLLDAIERYYQ